MKKIILGLAIIATAFIAVSFNQTQTESFQPGWYIVQPTAQYAVLLPSGADFYLDDKYNWVYPDVSNLPMATHEAVLVFNFSKDKYYCFDPNGRIVVFKGATSLTKAPASQTGVIKLIEKITLPGGEDELSADGYYWCASEDDEYFYVQLAGNKTQKVKKEKAEYHTGALKKYAKSEVYKAVEE